MTGKSRFHAEIPSEGSKIVPRNNIPSRLDRQSLVPLLRDPFPCLGIRGCPQPLGRNRQIASDSRTGQPRRKPPLGLTAVRNHPRTDRLPPPLSMTGTSAGAVGGPDISAVRSRNMTASVDTAAARPDNRPHVKVQIFGRTFSALVDTGAVLSYLGDRIKEVCDQLHIAADDVTVPAAQLADGRLATITRAYRIDFLIGDDSFSECLLHLRNLSSDLVLGMDILSQYNFQINPSAGTVLLNDRPISEPLAAPSSPLGGISLTLSQPEEEQLASFLETELPSFQDVQGTTHLVHHQIRLVQPEPIKQRSRHDSTGFTPTFLNFGRELILPNTVYQDETETPEDTPAEEPPPVEDRTDRLEKLKETFPLVRVDLARAFTAQSAPETGVLPAAPSHPLLEGISVSYTETAGLEGTVPTKPVCRTDRQVEETYYLDQQHAEIQARRRTPQYISVQQRNLCWRCGYTDHSRWDCTRPPCLFCSKCGLVGVMSRHCGCSARTSVRYSSPPRPYHRRSVRTVADPSVPSPFRPYRRRSVPETHRRRTVSRGVPCYYRQSPSKTVTVSKGIQCELLLKPMEKDTSELPE
ncbi:hypothetical protein NQ314_002807 [Rhamnusium bicolor]|uniref:CCHC-type domain-containing protein n=1 Tax=Rhamnusium bicolor TaxID=1586634 RepID=A0AAV8ZR62_9CUCU|nr:hypothetical protein NQ314_002807 [Rhamnusium bicolor]